MKLDSKTILAKTDPILAFIKRYMVFGFFIILLLIYTFMIFRIRVFTQAEPTDSQVTEKLQAIQQPHIDQTTIDKIQQLQDQNVQVQTLFNQARNNPFSEN